MGRIIKKIEIEGKEIMALFDTGATYTYILAEHLRDVPKKVVRGEPYRVILGGRTVEVKEICLISGSIEELSFDTEAVPIDEIGKADGHNLGAIIGAVTMEQWEIRLDPKSQNLDLEGLRRREFTEF
ncbi:retropepsin-like domain-containing protein [bacterium]|nr:retropepsin-like domain-containing protein [bacterium]MBU1599519.1 retropepsin-like domain-containing protein [bacterium]